jgi:hypothetical protein
VRADPESVMSRASRKWADPTDRPKGCVLVRPRPEAGELDMGAAITRRMSSFPLHARQTRHAARRPTRVVEKSGPQPLNSACAVGEARSCRVFRHHEVEALTTGERRLRACGCELRVRLLHLPRMHPQSRGPADAYGDRGWCRIRAQLQAWLAAASAFE